MKVNAATLPTDKFRTPSPASHYALTVGLFGIGLDAYWAQFDGLLARLEGYLSKLEANIQRPGVDIVNLGANY